MVLTQRLFRPFPNCKLRRWRQRTAATPSRWPSESPRVNQRRCVIGREKTFHEKESCAKRIMPCLLGCGCRMREEQWLEIPDEEMAFEEPRNRHDLGVPSCGGAFISLI